MSGWLLQLSLDPYVKEVNYGRNAPRCGHTTIDHIQMEDLAYSWYYRDYSCSCGGFIADTTCIPFMVVVRYHVPTDQQWTCRESWRHRLLARVADRSAQQDQPLTVAGIPLDTYYLFLICIGGIL